MPLVTGGELLIWSVLFPCRFEMQAARESLLGVFDGVEHQTRVLVNNYHLRLILKVVEDVGGELNWSLG